jgi:uncharacterized protein (DUF2252 family)
MTDEKTTSPPLASRTERKAAGKALRQTVPRSVHSEWKPPRDRPDSISLLEESNKGRVPNLIPIRYGRMLKSPLAYLRGSAIVMARDLASLPTTDIRLQICGDCHLQNFGWFATPERNLVFDVNDFDETRKAPWEWDLKRLAASVVVAARGKQSSLSEQKRLVRAVLSEYRSRLAAYCELAPLEMWYQRLDADALLLQTTDIASKKRSQQIVDAARQRTMDRLLPKMTERVNGQLRFTDQPPLVFHPPQFDHYLETIRELMLQYRQTLLEDRRSLLDRYRLIDVAYKVVGVGSVGLRCGIILMLDANNSPLVLQIKEARASVLEAYVGRSERPHHGHRIVHGQRLMQAASDIFLGWATDSEGRGYYFRQLRDMKMSVDVETMTPLEFEEYILLCGWAMARAHAKAGDAAMISGYLGTSEQFDDALAEFGIAYAGQVERDYESLQMAAKSGRIVADEGLISAGG